MEEGEARKVTSAHIAYVSRRIARVFLAFAAAVAAGPITILLVAAMNADRALAYAAEEALRPASVAAGVAAIVGLVIRLFPLGSPGTITRDGESLSVDLPTRAVRKRHIDLPAVRLGCLVPDGARTRAELYLANGDLVHVDAPDVGTATEVLRVAGVDAARQHARFRVDDLISRSFAFLMVASILGVLTFPFGKALMDALSVAGGVALWAAGACALTWLGMGFIGLPEITVGTDGIAYQRGPFRRFIPLSEIQEVRSSGVTLSIHLRNGRIKKLQSLTGADPGRAYSLELRIREALAASRGEHTAAQLEMLDRKGKSVSDWSTALAGITRVGSSYRMVGLSVDDLDAIVASPDVTPERRIGAALALRAAGHPAAGDRIRIAAAQCASSRVRIALERVGEGAVDLEAITEALAETEAEEAKKVRS